MSHSFVIRLDLSPSTGLGHHARCRALAEELCAHGATISAVVYRGVPHAEVAPLVDRGERLFTLDAEMTAEEDARRVADILGEIGSARLVLDSYVVDEGYQRVLRDAGTSWLQFDSHAAQPFWADWVIHASPGAIREVYEPLRRLPSTEFLLGPAYAVLGSAFRRMPRMRRADQTARRLLVCLGGGDDGGMTLRVLEWLAPEASSLDRLDVVIGSSNPARLGLEALLAAEPFAGIAALHVDSPVIHELMDTADLGITSGGTVSYEACASGLPQLLVCMADNQRMNCDGWARAGAGIDLGDARTLSGDELLGAYTVLRGQPDRLHAMSYVGRSLVDGYGAQRVARAILDRGVVDG